MGRTGCWAAAARARPRSSSVCDGGAGFFFSSRRRHTRCSRDWSSDVCSSDLVAVAFINVVKQWQVFIGRAEQRIADLPKIGPPLLVLAPFGQLALKIESVDEGVEVGAVITDL